MSLSQADIDYGRAAAAAGLVPAKRLLALAAEGRAQGRDLRQHLLAAGLVSAEADARLISGLRGQAPSSTGSAGSAGSQGSRLGLPGKLPGVGEQVGPYCILAEVARGGMGAVFRARDPQGQEVALKVLLQQQRGSDLVRFRREAEVGGAIAHPGICPVLDAGEANGVAYLTMPFLDGARTIVDYARDKELSQRERVSLILDAADALAAAHRAQAVHRDLKPSNLLVTRHGQVQVVDFGLAKRLDDERLTETGQVLGTPHYMAPEQVEGRAAHVDARCDLFALGVILHELLSGSRPFEAESTIAVMRAIVHEEPPELRTHLDPGLEDLSGVLATALAKDPARRYPGASELGADLQAVLAGEAISEFARREARRGRGRRLLGILVVLALLAAGAIAGWRGRTVTLDPQELSVRAGELEAALRAWAEQGRSWTRRPPPLEEWSQELERLRAQAGAAESALDAVARRLAATRGLSALARGELATARRELAALPPLAAPATPDEAGGLLAAGVAALSTEATTDRAAETLKRALQAGLRAPELRGWWALARVRAGLQGESQGREVLGALEAVARVRGEHAGERLARGQALLQLGRVSAAAEALAPLSEALSPALAEALTLACAELRLSQDDPQGAWEGLAQLSDDTGTAGERREALHAAALKRAEGFLTRLERDGLPPALKERLFLLLRIARRVRPAQPLAETIRDRLLPIAAYGLQRDVPVAIALVELWPEDLKVQRRMGALCVEDPMGGKQRAILVDALGRALPRVPPEEREPLVVRRVVGLERLRRDAECVAAARRYLSDCHDPVARVAVLRHVASAHERLDQPRQAVESLDLALAIDPEDASLRYYRARSLLELGREDDAYADAWVFARSGIMGDTSQRHRATIWLWEIGRARGNLEEVREAVQGMLRQRRNWPGWWLRLAAVEARLGLREAAIRSLEEGLRQLKTANNLPISGWPPRLLPALEALRAGDDATAILDPLVEELERLRGNSAGP